MKMTGNKPYIIHTKCRITRQERKAIRSLAASNSKGNKLKDIYPTDTNLSMVH